MAQKLRHRVAGTVQTTNATATTIVSWTIPDTSAGHVLIRIAGKRSAVATTGAYFRGGKIESSGGTRVYTAGADIHIIEDDVNWGTIAGINGSDLRIQVQGIAGQTIDWFCEIDLVFYQP